MTDSRACRTCLQVKALTEFHKRLDDRALHCIVCANIKSRARYKVHAVSQRARAVEYRKNNLEACKQRRLAWKRANKEKNVASAVAYGRRNPEKRAKATKKYRESNKERYNHYYSQRKAKLMNCRTYQVTDKELRKLYSSPCVSCQSTERQSLDHIIPIDLGGNHGIGNLQTLCQSCNSSKSNRVMTVWRKSLTPKSQER
jgi:5-methylcytosine-specific restriction endonuclease McrA